MPTDQELRAYALSLPKIYREIIAAFTRVGPERGAGFAGLAFQSIWADLANRRSGTSLAEVIRACQQLEKHGIVEIRHGFVAYPTAYGERLITAFTSVQPPTVEIPPLPVPPG